MEAIECIMSRTSTKDFDNDKMPKREDIMTVVDAACYAPSGCNLQDWHFTVVTNKEWLKKVTKKLGILLNRGEDYCCYYNAPVLIIASGGSHYTSRDSCACALENMFISAHALGLGTCWINQLGNENDKYIREELLEAGIPETDTVFGCCALGYPAKGYSREPKPRKNGTIIFFE